MTTDKKATKVVKFSKSQIINSGRYFRHRDLIASMLEDGKEYTLANVDTMLEAKLRRKVK